MRKRRARRLYKKGPLLAVEQMKVWYPDYNQQQLEADLPLKGKSTKRRGKSHKQNSKWVLAEQMRQKYKETGDVKWAAQYNKVIRNIAKPYKMHKTFANGEKYTFTYSNHYSLPTIKELSIALGKAKTKEAFENREKEILRYALAG